MKTNEILDIFFDSPVIAATDSAGWQEAVNSKAAVLFHLTADVNTVTEQIKLAKLNKKTVFVHIDLADGIGKDKSGIIWLKNAGVDGIISTRLQMIRYAKECGLLAVQRFFMLDSKGMQQTLDMINTSKPALIEIMPGVIPKAVKLFKKSGVPIIAGGLVETKAEVFDAINSGAVAVSTGKKELWNK